MRRTPFANICLLVAFLFNSVITVPVHAQDLVLPKPGVMLRLSPPVNPAMLKGMKVDIKDPFKFEFVLDQGDERSADLKDESTRLIKYFLASLTIPERDLWVNLSPYEKDRVIPDSFGTTEMGRDLLAQDYILKQVTASLIYPEDEIGRRFWKRVYEKASEQYKTTNIPVNTFNKVWIVPEKAVVYENAKAGTAYVVESRLKVMLEEDFLSREKNMEKGVAEPGASPAARSKARTDGETRGQDPRLETLGSEIVREIVIPELTREVNEGKNFAQLRQVYNSLILATWYKKKVKDSILSKVYADRSKVQGVNIDNPQDKQKIYQQYLEAFKKGVYNYIKEDIDPITQERTPRKYFSGGITWDVKMISYTAQAPSIFPDKAMKIDVNLSVARANDQAMSSRRGFMRSLAGLGAATLLNPGELLADDKQARPEAFYGFFTKNANPRTGLSVSHFGDNTPNRRYGSQTYDTALRVIAEGKNGIKILRTYAGNNKKAQGVNAPQTLDANYTPSGGVLNNIRIANFEEQGWWNNWEFKVSAGDNAWIGLAALHRYQDSRDTGLMKFARERADFLLTLQDEDGALRYGPRGQYHQSGDTAFYWNLKSTEHNESALAFLDNLFLLTKDAKYKQAADRIYTWIMKAMYSREGRTFARGAVYRDGVWTKDGDEVFSPDTAAWAPLDRMIEDVSLGATKLERLAQIEGMLNRAQELAGVREAGVLKGISFSAEAASKGIISIEWSSQFAVRYWRMARLYALLKNPDKTAEYEAKYNDLIGQIRGYFKEREGFLVAPYAVFADGRVASNESTGHGWQTPSAEVSVASLYYVFALTKKDPLVLDRAMTTDEAYVRADKDSAMQSDDQQKSKLRQQLERSPNEMILDHDFARHIAGAIQENMGLAGFSRYPDIRIGERSYPLRVTSDQRLYWIGPLIIEPIAELFSLPRESWPFLYPDALQYMMANMNIFYARRAHNIFFVPPTHVTIPEGENVALDGHTMLTIAAMLDNADRFKDAVVLDVGSGYGILSMIALSLGARKVHLFEIRSDFVSIARDTLMAAGWSAREDFDIYQADMTSPEVIRKAVAAVGKDAKNVIVLDNTGVTYGDLNDRSLEFAFQFSDLRLLINGGHYAGDKNQLSLDRFEENRRVMQSAEISFKKNGFAFDLVEHFPNGPSKEGVSLYIVKPNDRAQLSQVKNAYHFGKYDTLSGESYDVQLQLSPAHSVPNVDGETLYDIYVKPSTMSDDDFDSRFYTGFVTLNFNRGVLVSYKGTRISFREKVFPWLDGFINAQLGQWISSSVEASLEMVPKDDPLERLSQEEKEAVEKLRDVLSFNIQRMTANAQASRWLVRTGMGFLDGQTWWSPMNRMDSHGEEAHLGIDLGVVRDNEGRIRPVAQGVGVPALLPGRVLWVFDDLMQKTIVVKTPISDQKSLLTLYTHIMPERDFKPADEIKITDIIGRIRPSKNPKSIVAQHLHLGMAVITVEDEAKIEGVKVDFNVLNQWAINRQIVSYIDPLDILPSKVKDRLFVLGEEADLAVDNIIIEGFDPLGNQRLRKELRAFFPGLKVVKVLNPGETAEDKPNMLRIVSDLKGGWDISGRGLNLRGIAFDEIIERIEDKVNGGYNADRAMIAVDDVVDNKGFEGSEVDPQERYPTQLVERLSKGKFSEKGSLVIADVGSATGRITRWLALQDKRFRVIGLEKVGSLVETAMNEADKEGLGVDRVSFEQVDFVKGSGLGRGSVDALMMNKVLSMISRLEERDRLVGELARILRPGGLLSFGDFLMVKPQDPQGDLYQRRYAINDKVIGRLLDEGYLSEEYRVLLNDPAYRLLLSLYKEKPVSILSYEGREEDLVEDILQGRVNVRGIGVHEDEEHLIARFAKQGLKVVDRWNVEIPYKNYGAALIKGFLFERTADLAMTTLEKGGIDLDTDKLNLEIRQASSEGIAFNINPAMLKQLQNAPGFVPVIISIQPMANVRDFLGIVN